MTNKRHYHHVKKSRPRSAQISTPQPNAGDLTTPIDPIPKDRRAERYRAASLSFPPAGTMNTASASTSASTLPSLNNITYGGSYRHPPSARSAAITLPPLRVEDLRQSAETPTMQDSRCTSGVISVTIPRGLRPKEVPLPLRAVEEGGRTPPRGSTAAQPKDVLFEEWMQAYKRGTAGGSEADECHASRPTAAKGSSRGITKTPAIATRCSSPSGPLMSSTKPESCQSTLRASSVSPTPELVDADVDQWMRPAAKPMQRASPPVNESPTPSLALAVVGNAASTDASSSSSTASSFSFSHVVDSSPTRSTSSSLATLGSHPCLSMERGLEKASSAPVEEKEDADNTKNEPIQPADTTTSSQATTVMMDSLPPSTPSTPPLSPYYPYMSTMSSATRTLEEEVGEHIASQASYDFEGFATQQPTSSSNSSSSPPRHAVAATRVEESPAPESAPRLIATTAAAAPISMTDATQYILPTVLRRASQEAAGALKGRSSTPVPPSSANTGAFVPRAPITVNTPSKNSSASTPSKLAVSDVPRFQRNGCDAQELAAQRLLTLIVLPENVATIKSTSDGTQLSVQDPTAPAGAVRATVTVDEVVSLSHGSTAVSSSLLREVAVAVCEGYSASLLLSVANGCGASGAALVESAMRVLLSQVSLGVPRDTAGAPTSDPFFMMEVSMVLLRDGEEMRDWLKPGVDASTAPFTSAVFSTNPLIGTWLSSAYFQTVHRMSHLRHLMPPLQAWLQKPAAKAEAAKETAAVYVAMRQSRRLSTEPYSHGMLLSSLLVYITRSADGALSVVEKSASGTRLLRRLLRQTGDGTFGVAAACVSATPWRDVTYLTRSSAAAAVANTGFVSGDCRKYMEGIDAVAQREAEAVARLPAGEHRSRIEGRLEMWQEVSERFMKLMKDPQSARIPFFPDPKAAELKTTATTTTTTTASSEERVSEGTSRQTAPAKCQDRTLSLPTFSEAQGMFQAGQMRAVVVRNSRAVCGFESVEFAEEPTLRQCADGALFVVNEVVPRQVLSALQPLPIGRHTAAQCSLFAHGVDASIVSFNGGGTDPFAGPAWHVLAEAVRQALLPAQKKAATVELRIAVNLVQEDGQVLDLLSTLPLTPRPLTVASSPLCGASIHGSELRTITAPEELAALLRQISAAAAPEWTSSSFMHVLLVNMTVEPLAVETSVAKDVLLSSFSFSIFGSHVVACRRLLSPDAGGMHEQVRLLHHGVFAGANASVFLASLENMTDAVAAVEMASAVVVRSHDEKKRISPQVGSVRAFAERTRHDLEKQRRAANHKSPSEVQYLSRLETHIRALIEDQEALLDARTRSSPKFYCYGSSLFSAASTPKTEEKVALAAPVTTPVTEVDKEKSRRAVSSATGSHPSCIVAFERGGAAAAKAEMRGDEVLWTPTQERFDADAIVLYSKSAEDIQDRFSFSKKGPLPDLAVAARSSRSCALLGLTDELPSELHVATHPLWRAYAAVLRESCFNVTEDNGNDTSGKMWLEGSEVHLRMCAVQDCTLRQDFLSHEKTSTDDDELRSRQTTRAETVSLASSPLFGPVVRNTTVVRAGNADECQMVLRYGLEALDTLSGKYPSGTIVIACAVLKNVTETDVLYSSITAYAVRIRSDLPALRDVLAMDAQGAVPPALYEYSFNGPCRLLCITAFTGAPPSTCVEALRLSQRVRYRTNAPAPVGSLRTCLAEQRQLLESQAAAPHARAKTVEVVGQLADMLADPTRPIVVFPIPNQRENKKEKREESMERSEEQGQYLGDKGAMQCSCTVIVTTARRESAVTIEAHQSTSTVRASQITFSFSEVLSRADQSAVLRPRLIASIAEHVLHGRNSALLVAEDASSYVGMSLLAKVISKLIQASPSSSKVDKTLFMSVTAVRFPTLGGVEGGGTAMAKDLFSGGAEFLPLGVDRSPFFGACVRGSTFSTLSRLGDVYLTLKDAQKACAVLKSTLVVVVVLKQAQLAPSGKATDVLVSSLFTAVSAAKMCASGENRSPAPSRVFEAALDQREAAVSAQKPSDARAIAWRQSLLAPALGGDTMTHAVVGVCAGSEGDSGLSLLQFGARMMRLNCRGPLVSSASAVLARAEQHCNTAGAEETDPLAMAYDWRAVMAEAKAMLAAPEAYVPRAFPCT